MSNGDVLWTLIVKIDKGDGQLCVRLRLFLVISIVWSIFM